VQDTGAYVQHRLAVAAGAAREIFSPAALREVHRLTGGIPRLINVLCDRVLLAGYADSNHRIGVKRVRQAAREVPDASRRIGILGVRKVGWAAAASVGLLVVAGVAWLQWGSTAGLDSRTRVPTALGSTPELAAVSAARVNPDGASRTEVMVIVELPPPEAEFPSHREDWIDARESDAVGELGPDSGEARLESPDQHVLLEAMLFGRSPAAAVADATRATLALHRLNRSESTISSLGEALDEFRSRGLGVLEVFDTSFDGLRDLNYPALIELSIGDTEDDARIVALVGIEGGEAALLGVGNRTPVRISLDVVEEYWDGLAWVVWNPYLDIPDVISEGARGDGVLWLQQALSRLGYLDAHVAGVFDASTLRGVARFQGQHAVEPDGVAGPRTQMLIYADLEEFAPPQLEDKDAG
jgi:general secretion pathway protein A